MSTVAYPRFVRIRQNFPRPKVEDVSASVVAEMEKIMRHANLAPGSKVGITVGSRGIQNIVPMIQAAVQTVRDCGCNPVLLSAMGSHGGGTEEGQIEMLTGFGITEEAMGAPIIPCAEGQEIGVTETGLHAYMLNSAFDVDAIIPFNRVKTHTSFKGEFESGLVKMLVVGLGGPQGARQFHSLGKVSMLPILLRDVAKIILEKMPIIGGVGIVENAYEETAAIQGMLGENILVEESELLTYSKSLMPSLPVDDMDVLLVEEMGKNFSGTGVDTNIIGRLRIQGELEPLKPNMRYLAIWDISEVSHGNALGIGLADFTTTKLVEKIDRKKTYLNALTSTFPRRAKIPVYFDTEKEVFDAMLKCLEGGVSVENMRIVAIPNTLFLAECYVSEGLLAELKENPNIEILSDLIPVSFTEEGEMLPRIGGHV